GVDAEDPAATAAEEGLVAGPREVVVPVALDHDRARSAGQGDGVVGRAGVVDHDLVGHAVETGQQPREGFVPGLRDDAGGNERGRYAGPLVVDVSPKATIGDGVTIGSFTVVHDDVVIGAGTTIGSHCVIGLPTPAAGGPLVIGDGAHVRSHSVLYQGSRF